MQDRRRAHQWIVYVYTYSGVVDGIKRIKEIGRVNARDAIVALNRGWELIDQIVCRRIDGVEVRRADVISLRTLLRRRQDDTSTHKEDLWRAIRTRKAYKQRQERTAEPEMVPLPDDLPDCTTVNLGVDNWRIF